MFDSTRTVYRAALARFLGVGESVRPGSQSRNAVATAHERSPQVVSAIELADVATPNLLHLSPPLGGAESPSPLARLR